MKRNRFCRIGCLLMLGLLALAPGCSSTDAGVDENALGQDGNGKGNEPAGTAVKGKGPCLKVCLLVGDPQPPPPLPSEPKPVPQTAGPSESSESPAGSGASSAGAAPCAPDQAGCVLPPPPPPPAFKCMTFCAPAPGCKLVCDPFAAPPGPTPIPGPVPEPGPVPASGGPSEPGLASSEAGLAKPIAPLCFWKCPLPPPPPPPPPGQKCGPWPGGQCLPGETCDILGCAPGAGGVCVKKPQVCPDVWAPVCGCDGKTYGNDCERLAAGAALGHKGECGQPPPPPPCCKNICPDPSKGCPAVCDPSADC